VTDCCTGNPTSTFGGGGGTKLFCSQPVNTTNGATAKHKRQAFPAVRFAPTSNLRNAGDRVGFMPVPQFVLLWKKVFYSEERGFGYPMKMANNLLAVVLEKENDIARENFSVDLF
jgi:hypothetical protein